MASPGRVVAVVGDLFFRSKIQQTALVAGVPVSFATTEPALREVLLQGGVALVIVDLGAKSIDPVAAIDIARSTVGVRTVAFVSHIDEGAQRKAVEAGCEAVMPKSVFTRDLPRILMQGGAP